MAHRIIIMHDEDDGAGSPGAAGRHEEVLKAVANDLGAVGSRFFRTVKAQMARNMTLPEDLKELGDSQMWVLHKLRQGHQLTSKLAQQFNVTNPTMTRTIDTLVDRGYVERRHDVNDRRCIFLELTERGTDVGKSMEGHYQQALMEMLNPLTDEQLLDIRRAFQHIASLLPDGRVESEDISPDKNAGARAVAEGESLRRGKEKDLNYYRRDLVNG